SRSCVPKPELGNERIAQLQNLRVGLMGSHMNTQSFDPIASRGRCLHYRKRILDVSQRMSALHVAPAFSCLEIVDCIYFGLMRRDSRGNVADSFILSKGHGSLAQYVVLEELGVLPRRDLDTLCTPQGRLGAHPDYGLPGIEASTGSLGHGLPIAVGMALADKSFDPQRCTYVVLSDGELEEGSVWEAILLAPTLGLSNLIVYVDLNDFQSLGQISKIHPNFYPVDEKLRAFGWETTAIDGHDPAALHRAATKRHGNAPLMVLAQTTKGKGVSFMENVPMWHYRSPSPGEYQQALQELAEVRA
ncbi:MAG: transketolase, partial [Gemmataceae bacterium]|nr:transketolase [Gemmataceae bacterium]